MVFAFRLSIESIYSYHLLSVYPQFIYNLSFRTIGPRTTSFPPPSQWRAFWEPPQQFTWLVGCHDRHTTALPYHTLLSFTRAPTYILHRSISLACLRGSNHGNHCSSLLIPRSWQQQRPCVQDTILPIWGFRLPTLADAGQKQQEIWYLERHAVLNVGRGEATWTPNLTQKAPFGRGRGGRNGRRSSLEPLISSPCQRCLIFPRFPFGCPPFQYAR
ncbi:hypothetical protein QBC44DRAFT_149732 [Cladorrhinum sp. PSN332]|nr:hypothetical protein QBC44DRAFT_149732 [Cladorrhinum sp. PSN332]